MLDYESQNDSTLVHWSADGNSFIITDQNQFEAVSVTEDFLLTCICSTIMAFPS